MFCNASLYENKYMVYNKANVSKFRCHLLSSTWLKHSKWGRSKTCPMEMGGASIPIPTRERLLGNIRIHHQYIELTRVQRKSVLQLYRSSKWQPTFTSPGVILISQEKSFEEQGEFQFFCNVNFLKKIVCLSGKLRTKFTSPIAKSTSPRLLDMTFFAHCILIIVIIILTDIILSLLTSKNSMHISSAKFKE